MATDDGFDLCVAGLSPTDGLAFRLRATVFDIRALMIQKQRFAADPQSHPGLLAVMSDRQ